MRVLYLTLIIVNMSFIKHMCCKCFLPVQAFLLIFFQRLKCFHFNEVYLIDFFRSPVCVFCVPSKKFWLGLSQGFKDCFLCFLLWLNFCQSSFHKMSLLFLKKTFNFVLGYSWLMNNVVIVSGEQQKDSAIHTHASILPQTPRPSRLSRNTEQSSLS